MEYDQRIEAARSTIGAARHLVAFTGAGISTESGIPDYRGPDGVWTRRDKGLPPPKSPALSQVSPNRGHLALVKLQNRGILKYLISQNVDNLHLRSGIRREAIAELHGNSQWMKCLSCDARYTLDAAGWDRSRWGKGYRTERARPGQPECPSCGGRLISSIVNFGDPLPNREMDESSRHSKECDVFLAVGSSLQVTPAAHLPQYALDNDATLILINRGDTPFDELAHLHFREDAGRVLTDLVARLSVRDDSAPS